jgi:uncharacterized protein YgiM (DUF1202 family)
MKRYLLIALALVLALSLIACGDTEESTSDTDTSTPPETTTLPEETTTEPDETTSEPEETTSEPESSETTTEPANPTVFVEVKETVYVINTDTLNVRKSASSDSEKVGEMKEGESVVRTGVSTEWSRISFNGETCYVKSEYLTTVAPFEYTDKTETVYVNVAQLNLRAKASASDSVSIVATLVMGDELERTGVSTTKDENGNEWSRLLYNGQVCYANSLFLSTTKTVSDTLTFEDKEDTVYTIAETTVNLRSDASLSSTILASLTYGTKLERTGLATAPDADGILWSRVTLGDKVGYVSTAFLSETPVVTFTDADETLYVNASSLNVRALPAYESSVLTSLPMGTEVKCLGKATAADADGITWFKIRVGDTVGYASGRYLAAEMPE